MQDLFVMEETSSIWTYLGNNDSIEFSQRSTIFVLCVLMCSLWSPTVFAVCTLPTRRLSHIVLDILANALGVILRVFKDSSKISLLTPINFRLFTSAVSRDIILALMASRVSSIVRNSFPLKYYHT